MKIGDLVRCPVDDYYWWSDKVGLVIGIERTHRGHRWQTLCISIDGNSRTKFGANFVELVSEGR